MTFWRTHDSVRLRSRAAMWSERCRASGIFRVKICLLNPRCIFASRRKITCRPVRRVMWWRWFTVTLAVNRSSVAATAHYNYRRRLRGGWSVMGRFINSDACHILQAASLSTACTTVTRCFATPTIFPVLTCLIFTVKKTGGIKAITSIWITLKSTDFTR